MCKENRTDFLWLYQVRVKPFCRWDLRLALSNKSLCDLLRKHNLCFSLSTPWRISCTQVVFHLALWSLMNRWCFPLSKLYLTAALVYSLVQLLLLHLKNMLI